MLEDHDGTRATMLQPQLSPLCLTVPSLPLLACLLS